MTLGYESFFGLVERPFSLTSDPKYFFKSRSHGRAAETLAAGVRARERFLLVTGDLGVGKTVLCRTLVEEWHHRGLVTYVASPLMTPEAFDRKVLEDFGLNSFQELDGSQGEAVVVLDEAHTIPAPLLDHILTLSRVEANSEYVFRFAFIGQPAPADPARLGVLDVDDRVTTKVRLLPLGREECAAYIEHRLTTAGPDHSVRFSPRTHDYVFALSGGLPRLVNLLCERALQEAATVATHKIEPATIDLAASALQLLRARPRRFRWFSKRVS
jgi:general secretion pathway protein A